MGPPTLDSVPYFKIICKQQLYYILGDKWSVHLAVPGGGTPEHVYTEGEEGCVTVADLQLPSEAGGLSVVKPGSTVEPTEAQKGTLPCAKSHSI